ncbi:hypothetical protein [Absidia glauca]|uniref:Uncharacterized protein n=1 Tax=Absidia glauca TaxID=4829 RepID=A0A168NQA9_ABSGL|nr:hypothetical protein [Absidia glauca]
MRVPTVSIFLTIALLSTVMAVPEIENDKSEVNLNDCQFFTKVTCLRDCPRGYVGVYRDLCSAGEDQHECCAVRCCRSRHEDGHGSGQEA